LSLSFADQEDGVHVRSPRRTVAEAQFLKPCSFSHLFPMSYCHLQGFAGFRLTVLYFHYFLPSLLLF